MKISKNSTFYFYFFNLVFILIFFNASFLYYEAIVRHSSLEFVKIISNIKVIDVNCLTRNEMNPISLTIHYSCPNIFRFLIQLPNLDVNSSKSNPLYVATRNHLVPAVQALLEKGADPEIKCNDQTNSIELAKILGFSDILKLFEKYKKDKKVK